MERDSSRGHCIRVWKGEGMLTDAHDARQQAGVRYEVPRQGQGDVLVAPGTELNFVIFGKEIKERSLTHFNPLPSSQK